jgi:hypothetical protein
VLSTPGITPQGIQSTGELLKHQSLRQAFSRGRNQEPAPNIPPQQSLEDVNFGQKPGMPSKKSAISNEAASQIVSPDERGQPQVNTKNPLRPEAKIPKPFTAEQRIDEIGKLGERFPHLSYPELSQMQAENEARYMGQSEAERKEDERLRATQDRLQNKFQSSLEKKLQKKGPETFADLTGEMQNNLIRGMERDLASNPSLSEDDAVNTWTQKGLDLAKAKSKLNGIADSSLFALPIILDKENYRRQLSDLGDIYRKAGNSEEFYNTLQTKFNMSPQGASTLAYPLNKDLTSHLNKAEKGKKSNARNIAIGIEDKITPNDSLLTIGRQLLMNDADFNIRDFFNQLSEDKDEIGLTQRQRRELTESGQWGPSWGDMLILPIFRGL